MLAEDAQDDAAGRHSHRTTPPEPGRRTPHSRRDRLDTLLRNSPLQPLFRLTAARRLAVLAYHGVDDPQSLAAQLERLIRTAHVVSLDEVERAVGEGRPLPPRSVLVTFDDGDRTLLTEGLPLLTRHRIPAVAFVVARLIDGDQPFWWSEAAFLAARGGTAAALAGCPPSGVVRRLKTLPDADRRRSLEQLRASAVQQAPRHPQLTRAELLVLRDAGVQIGNHSLTHACLDHCDEATVRSEVAGAHELLAELLGAGPTAFAYPNGNADPTAERVLRELGYRLGFLFDHRQAPLLPPAPLSISRLRVNSTTTRHRFDTILSGLHPAVHRLRGGS